MKKATKIIITMAVAVGLIAIIAGRNASSPDGLRFGELVSTIETGSTLVIKAKITPGYSKKSTVDQNYYNVADYIRNRGGDKYKRIEYWAVADMDDGSEQKVVSFTVPESLIAKIKKGTVAENRLGDYVRELYIHKSLE